MNKLNVKVKYFAAFAVVAKEMRPPTAVII
jgi:hypothetical protein